MRKWKVLGLSAAVGLAQSDPSQILLTQPNLGRVAWTLDELNAPPQPQREFCKVCERATVLVLPSPARHEVAEAD